MRSKGKLLLAALLTAGPLAAGAAVAGASPALANGYCPPGDTCGYPPPIPVPKVEYSTSGLTDRDITIRAPSTVSGPGTIQVGARESFTITARNLTGSGTVTLAGEDKYTCAPPSGPPVTIDTVYPPSFTSATASVTRQPFSCPGGDALVGGTYQMYAEAEDSSGNVIARTATQTYSFSPQLTLNVSVPESSSAVDTGLVYLPGDTATVTAAGQIWAGVILTGNNGPAGWTDYGGCQSKFPLPCAYPYSLIGTLDNGGSYFYVGNGSTLGSAQLTKPSWLWLRTNDDAPGNGSGAFSVTIQVQRSNRF